MSAITKRYRTVEDQPYEHRDGQEDGGLAASDSQAVTREARRLGVLFVVFPYGRVPAETPKLLPSVQTAFACTELPKLPILVVEGLEGLDRAIAEHVDVHHGGPPRLAVPTDMHTAHVYNPVLRVPSNATAAYERGGYPGRLEDGMLSIGFLFGAEHDHAMGYMNFFESAPHAETRPLEKLDAEDPDLEGRT